MHSKLVNLYQWFPTGAFAASGGGGAEEEGGGVGGAEKIMSSRVKVYSNFCKFCEITIVSLLCCALYP